MIIYEDEELVIPSGIGPTFNTETGQVILQKKTLEITENGTTKVVPGLGFNGLSECNIITKVPTQINNQEKSVTYTENGAYAVTPDLAYTGMDRVNITVNLPDPPLQEKTVDSSNNSQEVVADSSYYGLSKVNINPIKGQTKTIDSSTSSQTVTADANYDALSAVTVNPYVLDSKTVDSSTAVQEVYSDVDGLSKVTVEPYELDEKTVDSSTNEQVVTSDVDGLSKVTVAPYVLDEKTVDSSTKSQVITSDADGLSKVTINPYVLDSLEVDSSTANQEFTGQYGTVTVNKYTLDSKTVDSSTMSQVVTSDVDGLKQVTVNPYVLDSKTVDSSTVRQEVTSDVNGLSKVTINPYVLDSKTIDPSTNQQIVTSDKDGLSSVTVTPISLNEYTVSTKYVFSPSQAGELAYTDPSSGYIGFSRIGQYKCYRGSMTLDASTNDVTYSKSDYFQAPPYNLSPTNAAFHTDVYSVKINKVTSAIDSNIQPQNIVEGVSILGVQGTFALQEKTVDSSTEIQVLSPESGYNGFSSVTVNPYYTVLQDKTVTPVYNEGGSPQVITYDSSYGGLNTITVNRANLEIRYLGGWYVGPNPSGDPRVTYYPGTREDIIYHPLSSSLSYNYVPAGTVNSFCSESNITPGFIGYRHIAFNKANIVEGSSFAPKTYEQVIDVTKRPWINPGEDASVNYVDGVNKFTIEAVDASIDANIQAGNIKSGVSILGVQGTFEGGTLQAMTVDSSTSSQLFTPTQGNYGIGSITVNPYVLDSKTVDPSTNSQTITSDEDGLASVTINPYVLDSKTVDSSTVSQTVTSDADGLSSVTINPYVLDSKTVDSSTVAQVITSDEDGLASVTVNPYVLSPLAVNSSTAVQEFTGQYGTVTVSPYVLDSSTVDSSTSAQTLIGQFGEVTINPYVLDTSTLVTTQNGEFVITSSADGLSRVDVSVNIDTQAYYNSGYSAGETAGIAEGIAQQKALLDSSTFIANGTYTRADGWDEITINVNNVNNQNKTVDSSTNSQSVTCDNGYTGLGTVTVNPYVLDSKTVNPSTSVQTVTSSEDGLSQVTVNAVTSSIDSNIAAGNIKDGVTILGVTGNYTGAVINNQNKTVDASTNQQSVTYDSGYTGLGTVIVNPYTLTTGSIDSSTAAQTVNVPQGYNGLSSVTISGLNLDNIYNTLAAY